MRRRTEGGEALAVDGEMLATRAAEMSGTQSTDERPRVERCWHALWTRSHCERLVHDQLAAKGFHLFLPEVNVWSSRAGLRRLIPAPMFPGYVFLHHAMDKTSYLEVLKARGLVRVLGERWDCLDVVPDGQVQALERIVSTRVPVLGHPFLSEGQRVRITRGPLAEVEGILVDRKPNKGLLVISVSLLRRSVAVEVDCTLVIAA
jgi:transcription termination/antitermination protein NusG